MSISNSAEISVENRGRKHKFLTGDRNENIFDLNLIRVNENSISQ
ncbi:hypothetical protein [Nostoc sp. ChiQUE01b]|nr:hypothetical protein [Nostoc sp. ChiQUE01b]